MCRAEEGISSAYSRRVASDSRILSCSLGERGASRILQARAWKKPRPRRGENMGPHRSFRWTPPLGTAGPSRARSSPSRRGRVVPTMSDDPPPPPTRQNLCAIVVCLAPPASRDPRICTTPRLSLSGRSREAALSGYRTGWKRSPRAAASPPPPAAGKNQSRKRALGTSCSGFSLPPSK